MKRVFLFYLLLTMVVTAKAGISITSIDSIASVCFNDGSIIINPTGGSPPYTYTIINGPSVPNVTYPIIGGNNNTFSTLHSGSYTVHIVDQSGNTLNVIVSVPGNYQFPVTTYLTDLDTLFAYSSLGKPPYMFALSTVSADGPFGSYQSSNVFSGLCNGVYYLRVLDSCQNFYTVAVSINTPALVLNGFCQSGGGANNTITATTYNYGLGTYTGSPPYTFTLVNENFTLTNTTGIFEVPGTYYCPDTIYVTDICNESAQTIVDCHPLAASLCSNFSDSTAEITLLGGTPPFTYTFYQQISGTWTPAFSQDSGNFVHIPYNNINETIGFGVTDACGRTIVPTQLEDYYMKFWYTAQCPFNDTVKMYVKGGAFPPGIISCIDCPSPQTQSMPGATVPAIFVVPDTGTYTIRATDACGETRDTVIHVPNLPVTRHVVYTSCNSVQITVPETANLIYLLQKFNSTNGRWDSIAENSTGQFIHSANGSYRVIINTTACTPDTIPFNVPWFNGYCTVPYLDTLCNLKLIVNYGSPLSDYPENYSLKSGNGTIYNESPQGGGNGIFFNIPPGNYTLISDSGCSIPQSFNYDFSIAASSTHSCTNQNSVTLQPQNAYYYYCFYPAFVYKLHNADTTLIDTSFYGAPVTFANIPPGNYLASVFFLPDSVNMADTLMLTGDARCVLDTLSISVLPHTDPIIQARNVNVCGANTLGNIPFTISGGFPPYTVSIFGQSTTITDSSSGILSNIRPDSTYTMRVSDSCGISSTFSVSVIDTCDLTNCSFVKATFTVADTNICLGEIINFQNLFTSGTTYQWTANGIPFSSSPDPSYTTNSTGAIVFKCVVTYSTLCKDSFSMILNIAKAPVFKLGTDTVYCGNFSRILSTGIYNTHWSTAITDSSIIVSSPGTYIATVSNGCGNYIDSVIISQYPLPVVHLVADTTVCTGDSVLLNAYFPSATYQWSNTATTDSIIVTQTGLYIVTVTLQTCQTIDSASFAAIAITANQLLPADTILCSGTVIYLKPVAGSNPTWQDGSHDSVYVVTVAGTYSVTVSTVCGVFTDSTNVVEHTTPSVNLGHDSLLCNGDSAVLNAYFPSSAYSWNTGSHADSIVIYLQGQYIVTVTSFGCETIDSVYFQTAIVNPDLLPADTTLCVGTTIVLAPVNGNNPVWQDGSHSPTYTVTDAGLYSLTVSSICGNFSDSIKIDFEICPSNIHVPDAFSPNGDGVNDFFTVFGESIADYEIKIFNRWGEVVYDSRDANELNNLSRGWDGTYKGKLQDPASFTYLITAKGYDGKDYRKAGYVILIR